MHTGSEVDKESQIEKLSGSLPASIGATLMAAFSGTPIAALLPVLTSSLASNRHKKRVEDEIFSISENLEWQKEKLVNLTDSQYKLVNESILAIFNTIDERKLRYLQNVVTNAIDDDSISAHEAVLLSRLVRDLSNSEAKFLVDSRNTKRFMFSEIQPSDSEALHILPESELGLVVSGLISLGLLIAAEPTWDDSGRLRFAPIVKRLVSLLNEKTQ